MQRRTNTVWILAILTVLLVTGTMLTTAAGQKASVPKVQDRLAMGEEEVKHLLLPMNPDKQGMVPSRST